MSVISCPCLFGPPHAGFVRIISAYPFSLSRRHSERHVSLGHARSYLQPSQTRGLPRSRPCILVQVVYFQVFTTFVSKSWALATVLEKLDGGNCVRRLKATRFKSQPCAVMVSEGRSELPSSIKLSSTSQRVTDHKLTRCKQHTAPYEVVRLMSRGDK